MNQSKYNNDKNCTPLCPQGWLLVHGWLHSGGLAPQGIGGYWTVSPQ